MSSLSTILRASVKMIIGEVFFSSDNQQKILWERMPAPSLCSVQFSRSVVYDPSQPHGPQHARPPCPSPTLRVHSNSSPLSWWCHTTISSSVVPFSFCLQSFPALRSFPMSHFFVSGGQSIGVSASTSVLPMNTPTHLGFSGWDPIC